MKTKLLAILLLFSVGVFAQEVPKNVQSAFDKKFGNVEDISWEDDEESYIAYFSNATSNDITATFSSAGIWQNTITVLSEKEIPAMALKDLDNEYDEEYTIEAVSSYENKSGTFYYIITIDYNEDTFDIKYNKKGYQIK